MRAWGGQTARVSLAQTFGEGTDWVSLPEVAEELGVHRTAVNAMVLDGRLEAQRVGPYWRVRRDIFERFAATYRRPPNVPIPQKDPSALPPVAERALWWIVRWDEATTNELREVMGDAPGNIRKATDILRRRGLAARNEARVWRPTSAGRDFARRLSTVPEVEM